jgi:hypothetical protein
MRPRFVKEEENNTTVIGLIKEAMSLSSLKTIFINIILGFIGLGSI